MYTNNSSRCKDDCIKEIYICLGEETKCIVVPDGQFMKDDMHEEIQAHLQSQSLEVVLTLYLELRKQVARGSSG